MNKLSSTLGAAALFLSAAALADFTGALGTVAQVSVIGSSSDETYLARGRLLIDEGDQFYRTYQWGGTACNGKNMSEDDVANFMMALRDRRSVTVTPLWSAGAGTKRCLVAYRITGNEVLQ